MCFSDATLGLMQMTVFQGPMVEEEHQSFAPLAFTGVPFYNSRSFPKSI
jgi:hypothetical protein